MQAKASLSLIRFLACFLIIFFAFAVAAKADWTNDATKCLVSFWSFNNTLNDWTGINQQVVNNSVAFGPDRFNNPNAALYYSSTAAYINYTVTGLNALQNFTIVGYWNQSSNGGTQYNFPMILGPRSAWDFSFRGTTDTQTYFQAKAASISTGNTAKPLNTWNFYAMGYNSSALWFYDSNITYSSAMTGNNNVAPSNSMRFGPTGGLWGFIGLMDDVAYFNCTLSLENLTKIQQVGVLTFAAQAGPPPPASTPILTVFVNDTASGLTINAFNSTFYNSSFSLSNKTIDGTAKFYLNGSGTYTLNATIANYFDSTMSLFFNSSATVYMNSYSASLNVTTKTIVSQTELTPFMTHFTVRNDYGFTNTSPSTAGNVTNIKLQPNVPNNLTVIATGYYNATFQYTPPYLSIAQIQANMSNTLLNLTVKDALTGAMLPYTAVITQSTYAFTLNVNGTGSIYVPLEQNLNYSVAVTPGLSYALPNASSIFINGNVSNLTINILPTNSINVTIFDEITKIPISTQNPGLNITVLMRGNFTGDMTYNTANSTVLITNLFPEFFEVIVSAYNYGTRHYYVTVGNQSTQKLNTYLLNLTGQNCTFQVRNNINQLLAGASVTQQSIQNGTAYTVAQGLTDIVGNINLWTSPTLTYLFVIQNAPAYAPRSFNLVANANPCLYSIALQSANPVNFETLFSDITFRTLPANPLVNGSQNFSISVSSPNGSISWFSISNGTTTTNLTTSPSGGTIGNFQRFSGTGGLTYTYCVQSTAFPIYCFNQSYYYTNLTPSNFSLISYGQSVKASINPVFQVFIFTMAAIFLTGFFVGFGIPANGAAILSFMASGVIFISMGWLITGIMSILMGIGALMLFFFTGGE